MSEGPRARPRKQVCAKRKEGFRQEEGEQRRLRHVQPPSCQALETPAAPTPAPHRHWARKALGQGVRPQAPPEDAHPGGKSQPKMHVSSLEPIPRYPTADETWDSGRITQVPASLRALLFFFFNS